MVTADPQWANWSRQQLDVAAALDEIAINDIVYAELSVRYRTIEALDQMVRDAGLVSAPIPRSALFLAGKAFQRYRSAGGVGTGVLPDFFIGAHAVISASILITRDSGRYRTYFPSITLITPKSYSAAALTAAMGSTRAAQNLYSGILP